MKNRVLRLKWFNTLLSVALLSLIVTSTNVELTSAEEIAVGYEIGQRAPDFTLPQLDGEPITLNEHVGQYDVTLLYFFFAAT